MYEFHGDKKRYFDMTYRVTRDHILPFIEQSISLSSNTRVLEIGCGEAGVLKAFLERGCFCTGIELEESRIELAKTFLSEERAAGRVTFLNKNIYDVDPEVDLEGRYDIIILKDVIEHIPDQARFMPELLRFMQKGGLVFFAFPPWMMPYGGHQQVLPGKLASKLPYTHLLPGPLYPFFLRMLGTPATGVATMEEIRSTGISIERFERIARDSGFTVARKQFYLFNPIYEHKFGLKPRMQWGWVSRVPFLRNFVTMGVYYSLRS
jgi:SAM-dependent methyltransferase